MTYVDELVGVCAIVLALAMFILTWPFDQRTTIDEDESTMLPDMQQPDTERSEL